MLIQIINEMIIQIINQMNAYLFSLLGTSLDPENETEAIENHAAGMREAKVQVFSLWVGLEQDKRQTGKRQVTKI